MALQENVLIKLLSTGGKKVLGELKNISKELTGILKKQEAVNKTALKLNKVRAATRGIKGSGLNLNTSTPLEGLDAKQVEQKLSKLSGTTRRYTVALNKANKELNEYVRSLATSDGAQNKFTGSNRKVTTQVSALQNRLNSLSRTNKEYTSTLQAVLRGEQALFNQQNKRAVDELAQFPEVRLKKDGTPDQRFTRTGVEDLVGTTIEEFNKGEIANSINGLNNYINRLEALRAKVELGSKSFNDLQQQIALVNLKLKEADPLSFSSKIDPKQKAFTLGPATDLSDNDSVFRQKLNFAEKLSRVDDKRLQLLSRINDSSLDEVKKQQLKNQLAQTDVNLQQKELELAKANNKEVDKELSSLNKKQQKQQFRANRGDRIRQSALIGGGFPLLFGGGPLQSIAGALGGGIGEAVSPKGGFAGSIAATAAVSQISQAVAGVATLGKALNSFTADIGQLTKSLGLAGTAQGKTIELIEQARGKQAALNEATKILAFQVGEEGVAALQKFGQQTNELQNAISQAFTRIGAAVADFINKTGIVEFLKNQLNKRNTNNASIVNQFGTESQRAGASTILDDQAELTKLLDINALKRTREQKREITILKERIKLKKEEFNIDELAKTLSQQQLEKEATNFVTRDLKEQAELNQNILKHGRKRAEIEAEINKRLQEAKKLAEDKDKFDEEAARKRITNAVKFEDSIRRQVELAEQLRGVLAEGVASAIEGLISGTKSLSDVLSSVLKQFGGILLRAGINNQFPGLVKGFGLASAQGNYISNGIRPFATGGMATRPTLGLVGEAGEDEYIIPGSKMSTAMQRYSAGVRGQSVIPGTGSSQSGGGGGASTTVNYSGPILTFNSEEFVPKAAVGAIIASATSQGAAMGETRTIRAMQNRRSIRTRVGI